MDRYTKVVLTINIAEIDGRKINISRYSAHWDSPMAGGVVGLPVEVIKTN